MAKELAVPAAVFLRLLEQNGADWTKASEDKANTVAKMFAQYRAPRQLGAEYALVEVVRQFLDTFADPEQKRMLHQLLAGAMREANRPLHAVKIEDLLDQSANTGGVA